ncbi:glycerophosphodiester phosphodiesterase protein kinase domain-containing gdpdl2 [Phtheirospermum japonicum]|uniref:Glycerophosphodiester phosphodiesterase protein kinase domain-containing gdpdl2 n=1 Tax=Phtheirospermum japonicum TaxID=374723 RepID=A0A830BM63_9LAMI|nr:glycerophosphodiester phosphodiesterase protein kinase domain-containing gdpdl2 [Phtheirospermum japonicum]
MTKSLSDKLGQGGYGSVYKGKLLDGSSLVAVKVLSATDGNGEDFINEVASISRTSHVNVVNLLGFCFDRCNTRIIHFDIKPQNILLDEEFCPKISDFGLGGVSHKSDVYSYGMMVLEMAGANTNVDQTREMTQSKIYEQVIVDVTRTVDGFVIEDEEETTRKMVLVGFWCIQTNPSDRPSISKVVEMLEGSVESIQIPPKPVLCNPTLPVLQISSSVSSCIETEHSAGSTHTLFKVSGNGSCIRKSA